MALRKNFVIGITVGLSLLATAFQSSTAARVEDKPELASSTQIRQVAAHLARCPELTTEVKTLMDERFGLLTQADINSIKQSSQACDEHYQAVPESASIALAYSALARQFDLAEPAVAEPLSPR